jgi:oligoribonuclease
LLSVKQIACIVTDKDLNQLDEGIEFIVKTDKDVLDKMNDWCASSSHMS